MVQPIFYYFFPYCTPLAFPSTMKAETSVADVLAMTMYKLEKLPPEMNIFEPFRTYSLPSFLAVVFMALESDPLSGSVRQYDEKSSIEMRPGRYLAFWAQEPNSSTIHVHMLWMVRQEVVATQPVDKAQKMTEAQSLESPVPDLQQIAENPACAASLKVSTGQCPVLSHSMLQGLNFFLAKSKACSLNAKVSYPRVGSSNLQIPSQIWDQSCANPNLMGLVRCDEMRLVTVLIIMFIYKFQVNNLQLVDRLGFLFVFIGDIVECC